MEDLSNKKGANEEDRISALPDELIHRIFASGVKLNEVVKSCILSKRWVNLWCTFPKLYFTDLRFKLRGGDAKYVDFITKFLLGRAQQVETCSIHIDLRESRLGKSAGGEILLTLNQAVPHSVRELCMSNAKLNSDLSFPVLTVLVLNNCEVSFTKWSLPFLTTLELDTVCPTGDETILSFKEFHCLKNLSLGGLFYFMDPPEFFRIDPPNLENLDIFQVELIQNPGCRFVISAPKLKWFRFDGNYVPVVSAEGGFPCLEQVWLSIDLGKGRMVHHDMYLDEDYNWELDANQVNEINLDISTLFHEFRETKVLTLFQDTFEVLSRIPNLFKYQSSPFVNLNSLYLRGYKPKLPRRAYPSSSNNHVIKYLLSNSPGAEFIIQIFQKQIWMQMTIADDNTSGADCDTSDRA